MKLSFVIGLLSPILLLGFLGFGGGPTTRYVMRVDRTFDRTVASQPGLPDDALPSESFRPEAPVDRWEVTIDGDKVVLTSIGEHPTLRDAVRLEGKARSGGRTDERRFDLAGPIAGGRFSVDGDSAELTLYGSGVPVISSERGKLVKR